jgi:hypothetical protein
VEGEALDLVPGGAQLVEQRLGEVQAGGRGGHRARRARVDGLVAVAIVARRSVRAAAGGLDVGREGDRADPLRGGEQPLAPRTRKAQAEGAAAGRQVGDQLGLDALLEGQRGAGRQIPHTASDRVPLLLPAVSVGV